LPRFFLVSEVRRAANLNEALSALRAREFDPRRMAVVEGLGPTERLGTGEVRVLRYTAREVDLETDTTAGAFLVSSEVHYPGWRAWVGGRERPLVLTNGAFRGLAVPAGRHRVRMRFAPRILWWGLGVSALGGGLLGLVVLAYAFGRPKLVPG